MNFWNKLLSKLENNCSVYVLTVIEHHGSSPGRQGFKMFVSDDGFIFGSIGGGVMEYKFVEELRLLLKEGSSSVFLRKQEHRGRSEDGSGMICSGEQTIVFHPLTKRDASTITHLMDCLDNNKKAVLKLTSDTFELNNELIENQYSCQILNSEEWYFEELIGYRNTLYIIGGGHVAHSTSKIIKTLGFRIVVIEDRHGLNTLEQNEYADEKLVVDYNEIDKYLETGNESYVAVMTNTYAKDKHVLSEILSKKYKYVGVLGSKTKIEKLFSDLREKGINNDILGKIHSPIGVDINSQTPDEIAISIAAEIIAVKNSVNVE
jgi:xanthine dehydrogenase accessory factor